MELDDFESVFGEPKVEWSGAGSVTAAVRPFLFQVHTPDSSHLKVHATNFFSSSFGAVLSIQQLEDMRTDIGISGSWSEFLEYVVDSIKFGDVKLVLEGQSESDGETLYDSWERFNDLLRRCPVHGFSLPHQIMFFLNGSYYESRQLINAAAGGSIMDKTPDEAYDLIDDMAMSSCEWDPQTESGDQRDDIAALSAKVECLNWKVDRVMMEGCNDARECQEGCGFIRNEQVVLSSDDFLGDENAGRYSVKQW